MDNKIEQKKSGKTGHGLVFFYFLGTFIFLFIISGFIFYQYSTQIGIIIKVEQAAAASGAIGSHSHLSAFISQAKVFAIIGEALVFLFFLLISLSFLAVYKYFLQPLKRLRGNVDKLLSSNFEYKIEPVSKNAFNYLDDFLNKVIEKFQQGKRAVEESNVQRGKELDKVIGKLWKENLDMQEKEVVLAKLLKESKILEENLKEEKDFVNAILACMDEGLFTVDPNGNITYINPSAEKILEVSSAEAVGKNLEEIAPLYLGVECNNRLPLADRPIMKSCKSRKSFATTLSDDYCFLIKSGKKIAVILASSPLLRGDKVIGAVATFRNVNTEKRLDEAKNSFISIASHQMRTPLTSMRWFSEMLISKDAGALNKEQGQYVEQVYQGILRMTSLLDLLLQIARIEAGRVKVEPTQVDFKKIIKDVQASLKPLISKKNQKVKVIFNSADFPSVAMDKEMVWQVFQNLLSNASRYAPVSGTITVTAELKDDMAEFSVADKGIGIPKDAQDRIFNKFYRAGNAIKHVPEGSGLGLYLVKSLVEGWGGKVWFKSPKSKGAIFYFTVPVCGMTPKEGEVGLKV
jgi:PAS domain S-box-containing protein